MSLTQSFFTYVGVATSAWILLKVGQILQFHLRPSSLSRYKHKHGDEEAWAIITGGGGGIGFGFAQELCRKGFHVILIGHLIEELDDAKRKLGELAPGMKVMCVVLDATKSSYQEIETAVVESGMGRLNVTILINNVGGLGQVFTEKFKTFPDYTPEEIDSVININNRFMMYLTKIMIPILARNNPSLILNISSGSIVGVPYQVLYSATKAFIVTFSKSLDVELKAEGLKNIEVMCIIPADVRSQSHPVPISWTIPYADEYARIALGKVGCGEVVCVPYWRHGLLVWLTEMLPNGVREREVTKALRARREHHRRLKVEKGE